jgi:hypothetical protein
MMLTTQIRDGWLVQFNFQIGLARVGRGCAFVLSNRGGVVDFAPLPRLA